MTPNAKQDAIVAVSLANLLMSASWRNLLFPSTFDYHIQTGAGPLDFAGVLIIFATLAALIYGTLSAAGRFFAEDRATVIRGAVVTVLAVSAINVVRLQFLDQTPEIVSLLVIPVGLLGWLLLGLTRFRGPVFAAGRVAALVLAPFVFVTIGNTILAITSFDTKADTEEPIDGQIARIPPREAGSIRRVVWIVFDEFDYRTAFDLKAVELPELARLRAEGFFATQALSPSENTLDSIPGLLTGKVVLKAEPAGNAELRLRFRDGSLGELRSEETVFTDVTALGGTSAALGWYHPYCRVFRDSLSACRWDGVGFSRYQTVSESVTGNLYKLFEHLPFVSDPNYLKTSKGFSKVDNFEFLESEHETAEVERRYGRLLADSKLIASDSRIDLAFLHMPFPHAPVLFDRTTRAFTVERRDYVNNLVLTDLYIGELRRAMESAGVWESTALIISSDHQWRIDRWKLSESTNKLALTDGDLALTGGVEDKRIPFIVRFPGRSATVEYARPVNTAETRRVVSGIMNGRISTAADVAEHFDASGHP
jgi:hypothetical protein